MGQDNVKAGRFFEGQGAALVLTAALVILGVLGSRIPGFRDGEFLGLSTLWWAVMMGANAIIHQYYVMFCWRAELHNRALTKRFGDRAFVLFAVVFFILIGARPLLAVALAWSNRGTLPIDPTTAIIVGGLLCLPPMFLMYSIMRYFGMKRAAGIDHFDPDARDFEMVKGGIYRFTSNAQYIYGFLLFWAIGFLFESVAALVMAAFVHAYIWVHYCFTEKPDMRRIYGEPAR